MTTPESLRPSDLFDCAERLYMWLGALRRVLPPEALVEEYAAPSGVAFWSGAREYGKPPVRDKLGFSYTVVAEPQIADRVRLVRSKRTLMSRRPNRENPEHIDTHIVQTEAMTDVIFTLSGPAWYGRASAKGEEFDTVADPAQIGRRGMERAVTYTQSRLLPITTEQGYKHLRTFVDVIADFMSVRNGIGIPKSDPLMPSGRFNPLIDDAPI